jgi:hypothetical protein
LPLELKKWFYVVSFGSTTHLEPKLFHSFIQTSIWKALFKTFETFESLLKLKPLVKTSNWNFFIEKLQHSYKLFCSWTWWNFKKRNWAFENFGALKNSCTKIFLSHENIHKNSFTHIPHKSVKTQKVSKQFVVFMSIYSLTQKQKLGTKLDSPPIWMENPIWFNIIFICYFVTPCYAFHFMSNPN